MRRASFPAWIWRPRPTPANNPHDLQTRLAALLVLGEDGGTPGQQQDHSFDRVEQDSGHHQEATGERTWF
jgi:hypothetical protein